MKTLSPSATRVLGLILANSHHGRPTTYREIMILMDWASPNAVREQVKKLRDAGLVTWEPGKCGTIRPTVRFVPIDNPGEPTDAR